MKLGIMRAYAHSSLQKEKIMNLWKDENKLYLGARWISGLSW